MTTRSRLPRESAKAPRSRQEGASRRYLAADAGVGVPFPPDTLVRINGSRAKLRVLEITDGTAKLVDSAQRIRWRPVDELRRVT